MVPDEDLSAMLPPPPPPRPARRDASITSAMRRFDGQPDLADPRPSRARPGWLGGLGKPQAGLLASALLLAVIGLPATLIVLRDQPVAPVAEVPPRATSMAPAQSPPTAETGSGGALPATVTRDAPAAVRPPPPSDVAPPNNVAAPRTPSGAVLRDDASGPAASLAVEDKEGLSEASRYAATPPPPPPPPAPAPPPPAVLAPAAPQESANQTTDDGADEIVVSGSRIRSKADARVDAPSPARRKQASPSLERLGSAIARNPGSANAYLERALFLRRQGDLVAARADLDAAHRLDPRDAIILRERGRVRRLLGDIRGAEIDEAAAVAAGR